MKKIVFFLILLLSMFCMASSLGTSGEQVGATLYFTDAQVLKLIPVRVLIPKTNCELEAKAVLDRLIEGRDENRSIKRTIPNIKNGISVKVKDNIAYVNIKNDVKKAHQDSREIELLSVYSIVNSLCTIDGIDHVRFYINSRTEKSFMGYLDMRETFSPDYML